MGPTAEMIPLDALPADVLDLIRRYYLASRRADQKHHASARLQACLRRHLTQRCEDPAHAGFVTYFLHSPRRVPCYAATHAHPRRITCEASRGEYFMRVLSSRAGGGALAMRRWR